MVIADRRGRLFGLAGDRIIRPGARALTFAELAERTGGDEATLRRLWRAFGLADWDSDLGVASAEEAEAFGVVVTSLAVMGEDLALELARSVGAALRGSAMPRTPSGAASPRSARWRRAGARSTPLATGEGLPMSWSARAPAGRLVSAPLRAGEGALRAVRQLRPDAPPDDAGAVGFVDMSGYTAATERLGEAEFARLISSFSTHVDETVRDLGGRVVKFVGDAAMIVAPDPLVVVTIAHELVERWAARGRASRSTPAWPTGSCSARTATTSGAPSTSRPGSEHGRARLILATAPIGEALTGVEWDVEWLEPQPVRGIAEPVGPASCTAERQVRADRPTPAGGLSPSTAGAGGRPCPSSSGP